MHAQYFNRKQQVTIFIFGLAVLLVGVGIYIFVRDPAALYILKYFEITNKFHSNTVVPAWLGAATNSFPTFSHAFAFSLFVSLVNVASQNNIFYSCVSWAIVDTFFEVIQAINLPMCQYAHSNLLCIYIENGVFDWIDIFSIILGSVFAYYFLFVQIKRLK